MSKKKRITLTEKVEILLARAVKAETEVMQWRLLHPGQTPTAVAKEKLCKEIDHKHTHKIVCRVRPC